MTHPRLVHDAKELAGCFYDNDRSATFRATWPSQDDYVAAKWHHFIAPVREGYAELLGLPNVPEDQKELMYEALVDNIEAVTSDGASSPLQLVKDSAAFVGDRYENRLTKETYGAGPRSLRERLRSNTALTFKD